MSAAAEAINICWLINSARAAGQTWMNRGTVELCISFVAIRRSVFVKRGYRFINLSGLKFQINVSSCTRVD
jgi:hypothetical protein